MIRPEDICEAEWAEWYMLSPQERWRQSMNLWKTYLSLGGSLDPEPDTQSPFHHAYVQRKSSTHGRPGLRIIRRGRV